MLNYTGIVAYAAITLTSLALSMSPPRVDSGRVGVECFDMAGDSVLLEVPARRVMMYPPFLWDYLTIDEGPTNILSVSPFSTDEIQEGLFRIIYPDVSNIGRAPTVGRTAIPGDPELVLAASPDAVFVWAWFDGSLGDLGIPLVRMGRGEGEHESAVAAPFKIFGQVSGKIERTKTLIERYRKEMQKVKSLEAQYESRPRALYVYRKTQGVLYVARHNSREDTLLQLAGAENAAGDKLVVTLGFEEILEMDPDVMFIAGYDPGDAVDAICSDPALKGLKAVRNRCVYREPSGASRMEGIVEEPLLLEWMTEVLHPELPVCFRDDFRRTFWEVYGAALNEEDLDRVLCLKENGDSLGYRRFMNSESTTENKDYYHAKGT